MTDVKVIFNSGTADAVIYSSQSNISEVEITNSDSSYYQSSRIKIYDPVTVPSVGDTIDIFIDDSYEFSGYVSRVSYDVAGTKVLTIQGIGKTYDLWRYYITGEIQFQNALTGYIVSSLVSNYTDITPKYVNPNAGASVYDVTFSNTTVGDCIAECSKRDGYRFYVNEKDELVYYSPSESPQFTLTDADILKIKEFEISDDELYNDIIVTGNPAPEKITGDTNLPPAGYIGISSNSKLVGVEITVPELTKRLLSEINFYLSRTSGANTPNELTFQIYKPTNGTYEKLPFSGNYWSIISTDLPYPPNWTGWVSPIGKVELSGSVYLGVFSYEYNTSSAAWFIPLKTISNEISLTNITISGNIDYDSVDYGWISGNSSIDFLVKTKGYAAAYDFLDNSLRFSYASSQTFYTDTPEFSFSGQFAISSISFKECIEFDPNSSTNGKTWRYLPRFQIALESDSDKNVGFGIDISMNHDIIMNEFVTLDYDGVQDKFTVAYKSCITGETVWSKTVTDDRYCWGASTLLGDPDHYTWFVAKQRQDASHDWTSYYLHLITPGGSHKRFYIISRPDWIGADIAFDDDYNCILITRYSYNTNEYGYFRKYDRNGNLLLEKTIPFDGGYWVATIRIWRIDDLVFELAHRGSYTQLYVYDLDGNKLKSTMVTGDDPSNMRVLRAGNASGAYLIIILFKDKAVYKFYYKDSNSFSPTYTIFSDDLRGGGAISEHGEIVYHTYLKDSSSPIYLKFRTFPAGRLIHSKRVSENGVSDAHVFGKPLYNNGLFLVGFGTGYSYTYPWYFYLYDALNATYRWSQASSHGLGPVIDYNARKRLLVRPVIGCRLDTNSYSTTLEAYGVFGITGSKYKLKISDNLQFYVDDTLVQTISLDNLVFVDNSRFGPGYYYNWERFRLMLVDTAISGEGEYGDYVQLSGQITNIKLFPNQEKMYLSTDAGTTWSAMNSGCVISFGWNKDDVIGRAVDSGSIALYGRHIYRTKSDLINNKNDAAQYAAGLLEIYKDPIYYGTITIKGRTDINIGEPIIISSSVLGYHDNLLVKQYTHRIAKDGFTTRIRFGRSEYDIAAKVARLEKEVFGG